MDVYNIMKRLHRSTHMHFQRTIAHGSIAVHPREKNAIVANRRQTIDRVFRSRQDDETLIEVARRLQDLVQKKRTRRLAKYLKLKSVNGPNQCMDLKAISPVATSSLEDTEYLGDWSTLSSANFSLDTKDIGS